MQISRRQVLAYGAASSALVAMGGNLGSLSASGGTWQQLPSMPSPFQEIYPAVFQDKLYVGGGFAKSDTPTFADVAPSKSMFVFDGKSWRAGPDLPQERHHLGLVSNGRNLFGVGGFYGVPGKPWQIQKTVFRLDEGAGEWTFAPSLPNQQAESVYAAIDGNIHVVGGKRVNPSMQRLEDSTKHYVLTQNEHWEEAAPALKGRNSAAGAAIDGRIYVVGGRARGSYDTNFQDLEMYDPKTDKWVSLRPMPLATAGHAATVLNGKLYVVGGEIFGPGGDWRTGRVFKDVWEYTPESDAWRRVGDMPQTRHGLGAVAFGGRLCIIGGGEMSGPRGMLDSVYAQRV